MPFWDHYGGVKILLTGLLVSWERSIWENNEQ